MKAVLPPLAHAGESHRREVQSAPADSLPGGGSNPSADPVAVPAAAAGGPAISPGLGIGLVVLSGWLWMPLLRRAGWWLGRRWVLRGRSRGHS